ncbi:hypothetical protein EU811_22935 [Arthrobacter sp. TS-15]|uniref:hypothetical protein n=1 Tax=Actinomycetes TaxID=1760 RepID=UPI00115E9C5E|nr:MULTISPECIES: hypothetical protein [Actinomycetes]TQS86837.1 hypothetical protein EU811_22935 [Arthrobacter sp. TS-15]GHB53886.1 hypothetical protein GCM10010306_054380 [Streptomyces umbrinus]
MLRITSELPYLDQAGHVYVPLAGPARSCLKLNRHASRIWREALRRPVDLDTLPELDRDFLLGLTRNGVLRTTPAPTSVSGSASAPVPAPASSSEGV